MDEWKYAVGPALRQDAWFQPLYVDPNDGILKRSDKLWKKLRIDPTPKWKRKKGTVDVEAVRVDDDTELRRIDGVWFEVKYGVNHDIAPGRFAFDAVSHLPVDPRKRHALSKRQLSSKELGARKLENEPRL